MILRKTLLAFVLSAAVGHGAIAPSAPQRHIGGQAGSGFSLLSVKKLSSPKQNIERLVFFVGTKEGFRLKGLPGYFNAFNSGKEIVIDFAQMPTSKMTDNSLKEILKNSIFIKSGRITQDPLDATLTLKMELRRQTKMKIIQIKGNKETARIVVDLLNK
ncbi:MAG: hypothetical protein ACK5V3_14990 [Bdellovibrionales bacterium]